MIRIAIVEDETNCFEQLKEYIEIYAAENKFTVNITGFADGIDITEGYTPSWDIIFMDIKMKHMDGMSAAKIIRSFDTSVIIIFITTMARYAIKGYEVDAMDFVLKPVSKEQFYLKFQKAVNILNRSEQKYLLLPYEERVEKVPTNRILFMEVKNHNLHIVTLARTYIMRYTMQEMEKELEGCHFSRCNNCYLVNLKNVTGVQKDSVIVEGYKLTISRPRKKQFIQELSDYIGAGYR